MIIQIDFDGTIITNNISRLIREKFATGDWERIEQIYLQGHLTVEQSNRLQFTFVKERKERLQDFAVDHINLRAGFVEFTHYCQIMGIPLVIVSSGLDFYIEAILTSIGIVDLEYHCGQALLSKDGIEVSYKDPDGNITDEGFKQKFLMSLKEQNNKVTYIGDGLSDLEPACAADHVFATGHLHTLLSINSIKHYPFSSFCEILDRIKRWTKIW
jgi:2-hydroxy-3-keto-5-methylthiopentenyl-1-phosphate phosphatase